MLTKELKTHKVCTNKFEKDSSKHRFIYLTFEEVKCLSIKQTNGGRYFAHEGNNYDIGMLGHSESLSANDREFLSNEHTGRVLDYTDKFLVGSYEGHKVYKFTHISVILKRKTEGGVISKDGDITFGYYLESGKIRGLLPSQIEFFPKMTAAEVIAKYRTK